MFTGIATRSPMAVRSVRMVNSPAEVVPSSVWNGCATKGAAMQVNMVVNAETIRAAALNPRPGEIHRISIDSRMEI